MTSRRHLVSRRLQPLALAVALGLGLGLGSSGVLALGADPAPAAEDWATGKPPTTTPSTRRIVTGERLSDWLLRQPADPEAFPLGLVWSVPSQKLPQARLKQHLLAQLAVSTDLTAPSSVRQQLSDWLAALPVTGRVSISNPDPRWLQAHPDQDPILDYDHSVVLPARPSTVMVVTGDARACLLPHTPGAQSISYLQACEGAHADTIDRVWLIQPDGHVQAAGIAPWNQEPQDEVAPGAWLWAPSRSAGWTPEFSALFAQFLATQGVAEGVATSTPTAMTTSAATLPRATPKARVIPQSPARALPITANDWGIVGLLQTPSARMAPAGAIRATLSRVTPYTRTSIIFQPFDSIETGFRYNILSNLPYGLSFATVAYVHHSADVKFRLLEETATRPQLALGFNDLAGTGLFASEFLVASKRWLDLDFSLGLGWGNLGTSNNLGNPLSVLSKNFNKRLTSITPTGGTVNTSGLFHGPAALFGGVQYQTPWDKLLLKVERDGNNYQHEPLGTTLQRTSPINLGLVYRYSPEVDLTAGIERGNTLMFSATFHGQLDQIFMPKLADPAKPPVRATLPTSDPDWARTAADLTAQTHWSVLEISRDHGDLRVTFGESGGPYWKDRIERIAAVLHRDAPADLHRFVLVFAEHGVPMTERVILRDAWLQDHLRYQAMADHFEAVASNEPRDVISSQRLWRKNDSPFSIGLAPSWQQTIGGPHGYVLYQLGVATPLELNLTPTTWISGAANLRLSDNYNNYTFDAPSNLPRVRTYLRQYQTTAKLTLPNLQITHIGQWRQNQFYSLYGGYLESEFGGVGAEWLYRPWQRPFAFGIDMNRVKQRDFRQNFDFNNAGTQTGYTANTGHATLYWDTGYKSTHVNLSAGQYLAGDRGITLEVNRTFKNGVTLGAWATKTNISSAIFGEGSFDKGIFVAIPFDAILPFSSPAVGTFAWDPLSRDGGARLNRSNGLYGLTQARDGRLNRFAPAHPSRTGGIDEDGPLWEEERSLFGDFSKSGHTLGDQLLRGNTTDVALKSAAFIAGAALLDKPVANWAARHQTPRLNRLGQFASEIPLLLVVGTGALWWGAGGDLAAETAWTSVKSAAWTLMGEELTKFAVGRARPEKNLGTFHFTTMSKSGFNSSFPSQHMGIGFALVTPLAQQYDAPWLYGIAGLTAFGRIQQQKHFASDVVAGSLFGYGVGTLLLDQQHQRHGMPKLAIGTDGSISARWQF